MPNKLPLPAEEKKDLATKEVYYYIDQEKKIKVKSKEIFKNGKKIVHYPFYKGDGQPKYTPCTKITYIGYKTSEELPRGYLKNANTGYGFTKVYGYVIYPLIEKHQIKEIIVQKNIPSKIEESKLFLNPDALDRHYPSIDSLLKAQREEIALLVNKILIDVLPANYQKDDKKYVPDSLHNYIKRTVGKDTILSDKDI